jgi:hypothetical protein
MPLPQFGAGFDAMAGGFGGSVPLNGMQPPTPGSGVGFGHGGSDFDFTDDLAGAFDGYNPPPFSPPFGPPGGFPPFGPPGTPDFPGGPPRGPGDGGLTPTTPLPPPDF